MSTDNPMHPMMNALTGVIQVPPGIIHTRGGMPELEGELDETHWLGKIIKSIHAYAPDLDTVHASFWFRSGRHSHAGMTFKKGEQAEIRIDDDIDPKNAEKLHKIVENMTAHHTFRNVKFSEALEKLDALAHVEPEPEETEADIEYQRKLERAQSEVYNGIAEAECPKCGRYYGRIEPDASFTCHEDGCDGRIQSASMDLGII